LASLSLLQVICTAALGVFFAAAFGRSTVKISDETGAVYPSDPTPICRFYNTLMLTVRSTPTQQRLDTDDPRSVT
jgi:hypothetical protein